MIAIAKREPDNCTIVMAMTPCDGYWCGAYEPPLFTIPLADVSIEYVLAELQETFAELMRSFYGKP